MAFNLQVKIRLDGLNVQSFCYFPVLVFRIPACNNFKIGIICPMLSNLKVFEYCWRFVCNCMFVRPSANSYISFPNVLWFLSARAIFWKFAPIMIDKIRFMFPFGAILDLEKWTQFFTIVSEPGDALFKYLLNPWTISWPCVPLR